MTGCLLRLVLLPVIVAAFYPVFSLRAPLPTFNFTVEGPGVAAFITGLFTWWAVISWLDMRGMKRNLALAKSWRLEDGERAAIIGHIEAKDKTLTAPFTGEECVGYWYEVTHHSSHAGRQNTEWTDYEGFALVPSVVRGPMRTVNVLAVPDKELFHETPARIITSDEDLTRAEEYVKAADFGEMPKGRLADTRTRLIHEGPGDFREDKQAGKPPESLRGRTLKEKIIKNGDRVMIAGVYSAELDGLAPDPDTIMRPFHITVGGEELPLRKMRNRVKGMAISTALAAATACVYYLVFVPIYG